MQKTTSIFFLVIPILLIFIIFFGLNIKPLFCMQEDDYNVILIVVDALQADHLSCYGYNRKTTSNIDRLAEESVLFKRHFAQAHWTLASISSIFTSLYPNVHQANKHNSILPDECLTLAEILKTNGFITQAFVSGYYASSKGGLSKGFDNYNEANVVGMEGVSSYKLNEDAIKWLELNKNKRFFLFLHYYKPHYNYMYHKELSFYREKTDKIYSNIPIEEIRKMAHKLNKEDINTLIGYYDGEIKLVDTCLGDLFNCLKKINIYGKTIIVITADHGEEFGAHGYYEHWASLYNEILHTPLIFYIPNNASQNKPVLDVVSSVDISPTILDLLNITIPESFQGESLSEYILKGGKRYYRKESIALSFEHPFIASLQTTKWKIIRIKFTKNYFKKLLIKAKWISLMRQCIAKFIYKNYYFLELYDLEKDPLESKNVSFRFKDIANEYDRKLSTRLKELEGEKAEQQIKKLEKEEINYIKYLGYL